MFALVFLDDTRRIRIWIEGGSQQEMLSTTVNDLWHTANSQNWSKEFPMDMVERIRATLVKANELKNED